jgi:hypothetical protein
VKYIVKIPFVDKYSNELHKEGSILDITKTRATEILTKGEFIECIKPEKENKKQK